MPASSSAPACAPASAARGQPEGGRRRPRRQRARRARAVRRPGDRRRLRHRDHLRRRRSERASTSAARSPRASRSRWRRWPTAARSCARSSWSRRARSIGKNTVEALQSGMLYGFAGQVDGCRPDRRASSGPAAPRRRSSPPAGWRRWWSTSCRVDRRARARAHPDRPAAGVRAQPAGTWDPPARRPGSPHVALPP